MFTEACPQIPDNALLRENESTGIFDQSITNIEARTMTDPATKRVAMSATTRATARVEDACVCAIRAERGHNRWR